MPPESPGPAESAAWVQGSWAPRRPPREEGAFLSLPPASASYGPLSGSALPPRRPRASSLPLVLSLLAAACRTCEWVSTEHQPLPFLLTRASARVRAAVGGEVWDALLPSANCYFVPLGCRSSFSPLPRKCMQHP